MRKIGKCSLMCHQNSEFRYKIVFLCDGKWWTLPSYVNMYIYVIYDVVIQSMIWLCYIQVWHYDMIML